MGISQNSMTKLSDNYATYFLIAIFKMVRSLVEIRVLELFDNFCV